MADNNSATEDKNEGANLPEGQGGEGEGNTEKPTEGEGSSSNEDQGDEGDEGEEGEGDDINEDEEPATRSAHNAFHAGQRIAKKQVKETKPAEGEEGEGDEGKGEGAGKGGDQATDPTDIESAVANAIKPFTDKMAEQDTKDEVNSFISENPEFKPYTKKILNFANHATRRHLPIETVALEAVGRKGLLQMGAKRAQEADAEGKQTQSGGTSTRNAPSGKSVKDMSSEEFEAEQNKVRFGQ